MSIKCEFLNFPRQTAIAEVFDFLPPVKKFVVTFVVKKNKILILLGKIGSGGWDRTNYKVSYLVIEYHILKGIMIIKCPTNLASSLSAKTKYGRNLSAIGDNG